MADRYNEGKALDAVLRFIEVRDHAARENDGRSPDELNDPDEQRRVDYVCSVGQTLYAFEHTGIEPFPNQIRLADHNQKLFDPIIERFDHRTDREVWELYVPVEASAGLTVGEVGQVQNGLIKWIEANAGRIPVVPRYGRHANPPLGEVRQRRSVSVFSAQNDAACGRDSTLRQVLFGSDCATQSRTTASGASQDSEQAQIPEARQVEAGFGHTNGPRP
jgi:hypothetical protein